MGGGIISIEEFSYLVLVEVVKVKQYLFSNSKLKSIRGASYLLDKINIEMADEVFSEFSQQGQKIYFRGGNNKALFKEKEQAQAFVQKLKKVYHKKASGVKVLSVIEKKREDENLKDLMSRAQLKIKNNNKEGFKKELSPNPYGKRCNLCGVDVSANHNSDISAYLCGDCQSKVEAGANINKNKQSFRGNEYFEKYIYNVFFKELEKRYGSSADILNFEFVSDLDEIGAENKNGTYIGFVYADGNRLGTFLEEFNETYAASSGTDYVKEQERFSRLLDESTKEAIIEAVIKVIDPEPYLKGSKLKEDKKYPVEFVMAGGDDLIVIVPGDKSIKLTEHFTRLFEKKVNSKLQNGDVTDGLARMADSEDFQLTISSGITISKPSYPMEYLFDYTTQLQKEAKKRSNLLYKMYGKNFSTVDFDIINSSKVRELTEKRKKLYQNNNCQLTLRPYVVAERDDDDLNEIFMIQHLIDLVSDFKKGSPPFPRTKLRQFQKAVQSGKQEGVFQSIKLISKLDEKHKKIFADKLIRGGSSRELFPWFSPSSATDKVATEMMDVLEVYDFIHGGE